MDLARLLELLTAQPPSSLHLLLPDGSMVPPHFHVTEVGRVQKDFIDCGGTVRSSTRCVLQVWVAGDLEHRLRSDRLAAIIRLALPLLARTDLPVEVEYEQGTVAQFPLGEVEVTPGGLLLHLGSKQTACLAPDRCGLGTVEGGCCEAPSECAPTPLSLEQA